MKLKGGEKCQSLLPKAPRGDMFAHPRTLALFRYTSVHFKPHLCASSHMRAMGFKADILCERFYSHQPQRRSQKGGRFRPGIACLLSQA